MAIYNLKSKVQCCQINVTELVVNEVLNKKTIK